MLAEVLLIVLSMGTGLGYGWGSRECGLSRSVFALTMCLILTVCCANPVDPGDDGACRNSTISKPPHFVLEKESIKLTCSKAGTNASDLYFKQGKTRVPDQYTNILNSTAIQMSLPPLTRHELAGSSDSYHFKCMEGDTCVGNRNVFIEYYPVEAKNVTCRIYNWDRMFCWWSLWKQYKQPDNIVITCNFTGDKRYSSEMTSRGEREPWAVCPYLTQNNCSWDAGSFRNPYNNFTLKIKVTNKYRLDASVETTTSFDVDSIVQLDPVDKASIVVNKTEDPNCLRVSLPVHSPPKNKNLTYRLTYSSQCSGSKTLDIPYLEDSGLVTIILCSLYPYVSYSASLTGRFVRSQLWSEPTVFQFKTDKQVPKHSPRTTVGLYEHIEEPEYNIRLYFKPLDNCEFNSDLKEVEYQVSMGDKQRPINIQHPVFYANLKIGNLEPVTVHLKAKNDVGVSAPESSIVIFPKPVGMKPSELTVEFLDKPSDLVQVSIEVKDKMVKGHVLVWCKGTAFCEKAPQSKVLSLSELSLQIEASQGHRFGLVTEYQSGDHVTNTGIFWEKCLYKHGKVPASPPRNVHRADQQPDEGLTLEWLPYECSEGYIHHYKLSYCQGTLGDDFCNCTAQVKHVNVSKLETSHTVKGLSAGSQVCTWLQGVGSKGSGPSSDPVAFTIIAEEMSVWLYVGASLLGILLIVLIIVACCCCRRIKKKLEGKKHVKNPDIEGLGGKQALLGNDNRDMSKIYRYKVPLDTKKQRESPADSGSSSLSATSSAYSTVPNQISSDSAISSDQSLQIPSGQADRQTSGHTGRQTSRQTGSGQSKPGFPSSSSGLDSYQKASNVSAGITDPDSYMKATVSDSHEGSNPTNNNVVVEDDRNSSDRPLTDRTKLISAPQDDQSLNNFLSDLEEDDNDDDTYELNDISAILGE